MCNEEIARLIVSFLGGGLISALINLLWQNRSAKIARRVDRLKSQINTLYGPLFYLTSQNESFFQLHGKIHEAYKAEFEDQDWSDDENTQREVKKDSMITLDLANTYVRLVKENNDKIQALLSEQYPYIDQEDIDVFRQHIVDYVRMKTEVDDQGVLKTPLDIYSHLGDISFMRQSFIEAVKERFKSKKNELEKWTR